MEMDVNIQKSRTIEPLMTISAGSYSISNNTRNNNNNNNNSNNNNNNNNNNSTRPQNVSPSSSTSRSPLPTPSSPNAQQRNGCYGILSRLLCTKRNTAKTASSSTDYNNFSRNNGNNSNNGNGNGNLTCNIIQTTSISCLKKAQNRRTPQEIYFESRGKSCKKLLKFNGNSNKILLYPEEGWARTASSSYWTITPCWWQPNYCRIEEFSGTQRQVTKAKMLPLEQQGSLLIAGHFENNKSKCRNSNKTQRNKTTNNSNCHILQNSTTTTTSPDEFKLYLSSNVSMEDYNMGYCLTGFVERRCQQTNTFQMTHFAVIKRQWPSIGNCRNDVKST